MARNRATALGILGHDAASPDVMGHSPDWIREFARLYFRPRTPTEFRSEGFRAQTDISMGAHRPMPIVMVFDAVPILCADGTQFTDGNAASHSVSRGSSAKFLSSIPFERVHHDGPISESHKADIVFRRCAEVLVPNQLGLEHLRHILCRSQAEHETLLNIVSPEVRRRYARFVGVSTKVHYKYWTFLESVSLAPDRATFRFNAASRSPGPFRARVQVRDLQGKKLGGWENEKFMANDTLSLTHGNIGNPIRQRVTLTLDGALAFEGVLGDRETLL
ncbi:hypothetical protein DSM104443_00160 [Usitatibacter rugosus]|uniref:DarT domain-containing protein n=1 Tax=Usitatibacter rugosus TaxID=2732067 RepID=A0A6M4GRM9_9PROT|nr:hypothetical protein DSM104443_00160 [Usitatibacter rugosus]